MNIHSDKNEGFHEGKWQQITLHLSVCGTP